MACEEASGAGAGRLMPEPPEPWPAGDLGRGQTSRPLVSVVIPVYNGERYLGEALDSVLQQTSTDTEVVVVDDGSTDRSAEIVAGYSRAVRYYRQPHSGSGAARNRGVRAARGSYFAFLDADDIWASDKLALQLAVFAADPEVDLVYAHVKQFYSPELSEAARQQIRCPEEAVPGQMPGTMMVERDAFLRVGPFRENVTVGEGVDWHMRATELGLKMVMLPDVLLWRRLHESNLGRRQRDARTDYARVLKAALDRRRAEQERNSHR